MTLLQPIEQVANQVYTYLQNQNAMLYPGEDKPRNFITVDELCAEYHIGKIGDWPKLRDWMIENGYPIAPGSGGYYVGPSGTEVLLDFRRLRQIVSAERRAPKVRSRLRRVQESGGAAFDVLRSRYGISDVSQLELEDLKRVREKGVRQNGQKSD